MRLHVLIPAGVCSVALLAFGLATAAPSLRAQTTTTASTTTAPNRRPRRRTTFRSSSTSARWLRTREIVEGAPGKCPKCGMTLTPARAEAGLCLPDARRDRARAAGNLPHRSPRAYGGHGQRFLDLCGSTDRQAERARQVRGREGSGAADRETAARRSQPRHGGQFFMADTGLHHVEGTLPEPGLFRVYFYDEATKPMSVLGFSARAIVTDAKGAELETAPLKPGRLSNTLEAGAEDAHAAPCRSPCASASSRTTRSGRSTSRSPRLDEGAARRDRSGVTAAVRATGRRGVPSLDERPQVRRVAFAFQDPAPPQPPATPNEAIRPSERSARRQLLRADAEHGPQAARSAEDLEGARADAHRGERQRFRRSSTTGALPQVWKHAMDAKDIALGLRGSPQRGAGREPRSGRRWRSNAVTSSWEMEGFADLGDKQKVLGAHRVYTAAVADLKAAYAKAR